MTPLEVVTAARELLSDPARWTKGANARNEKGDGGGSGMEGAVCWCAVGALRHVSNDPNLEAVWEDAYYMLAEQTPRGEGVMAFNDGVLTTHADVLAMFDRAIEWASQA